MRRTSLAAGFISWPDVDLPSLLSSQREKGKKRKRDRESSKEEIRLIRWIEKKEKSQKSG